MKMIKHILNLALTLLVSVQLQAQGACNEAQYGAYLKCMDDYNSWSKSTLANPVFIRPITSTDFFAGNYCSCLNELCNNVSLLLQNQIKYTESTLPNLVDITILCNSTTGCTQAQYDNYLTCGKEYNAWAQTQGYSQYILADFNQFSSGNYCVCLDQYCTNIKALTSGQIPYNQATISSLVDISQVCNPSTGCGTVEYDQYLNCLKSYLNWAKPLGYYIPQITQEADFISGNYCLCLDQFCNNVKALVSGQIAYDQNTVISLVEIKEVCNGSPSGCTEDQHIQYKKCLETYNAWVKANQRDPVYATVMDFQEFVAGNYCECLDQLCKNIDGLISGHIAYDVNTVGNLVNIKEVCNGSTGCGSTEYDQYMRCLKQYNAWAQPQGYYFADPVQEADFISQNYCACLEKYCYNVSGLISGSISYNAVTISGLVNIKEVCNGGTPDGCTQAQYDQYLKCAQSYMNWAEANGQAIYVTLTFSAFVAGNYCACLDQYCTNVSNVRNGTAQASAALLDISQVCAPDGGCTQAEYDQYMKCVETFNTWSTAHLQPPTLLATWSYQEFVERNFCECLDNFCGYINQIVTGQISVGGGRIPVEFDFDKICNPPADPTPNHNCQTAIAICDPIQQSFDFTDPSGACASIQPYYYVFNLNAPATQQIAVSVSGTGATYMWYGPLPANGQGSYCEQVDNYTAPYETGNIANGASALLSNQAGIYVLQVIPSGCAGTINISGTSGRLPGLDCTPSLPCADCITSFMPGPGRYVVSAWVKEAGAGAEVTTYTKPSIAVSFTGSALVYTLTPQGRIIDGWQRIESNIVVPVGSTAIEIKLQTSSGDAYFDDIRFFPTDGSMMSYVYDPVTLRLMAELDERNYATLYEYDEEGKLIRVKKETEKGIMTIQENRDNIKK